MNSFLTKLLASVILVIMCLFSILPTVQAAMIQSKIENDNGETEKEEEVIIQDNAEKNDSFQVMLASILNTSENLDINNVSSSIPNEKGIWIKENNREYIVNLINALTNKIYKVNEIGFLVEDTENVKIEQDKKDIYNLYTEKIDQLINNEKLIVISIDNKYKQLNDIDNDIIDIKVEEEDYALLFIDNENEANSNEIILLNAAKYNVENKENTIALLMNKILEVYYHDDEHFKELQQNGEFIDNSGIYINVINKVNEPEGINNEQNNTEDKIEDKTDITERIEVNQGTNSQESNNVEKENEEIITDSDEEQEENTTETNKIVEDNKVKIDSENEEIMTETEKNNEETITENVEDDKIEINSSIEETINNADDNNEESIIESDNNTQDVDNKTAENTEETKSETNKDTTEKDNIFDDSVTENDFNIITAGILADNVNLENRETILANKPNGKGIWISEDARQQFLNFLNKHTIYTYTVDSNGYLVCDNIMKDNANLDMAEKAETEVDTEIKNILTQNSLIMISLDNKYLGYDEKSNLASIQLTNEDYVKSFSINNQRIVILNKLFYENTNYNMALSDYFVKSLENVQEKVLKGELTFNKQPLTRSDTSKPGNMLSAQTVYAGPYSSNYASVGSVSSGEMVYLLGQSAGWYHIQYIVTSTGKQKSGFVPVSSVNNNGYSVHEEQMTGGQNFATETVNILSCDNFDLAVSLGSVYAGEGLTVLYAYGYSDSSKSYGVAYVEISTSSGTKRGYIYSDKLTGINYPSSVALITATNSAYAGPSSTSYARLGSASVNEYVTILAKNTGNDWVWVEYNTTSGRKRGFMSYSSMTNCNHPGSYNDLPVNNGLRSATQDLEVLGGPSAHAASIGSISTQEVVSLYSTERGYAYIEYSTSNGAKRGYVPENCLANAEAPTIPTINAYGFTEGTYGTSGKGRSLKYYKLGSGENVAFAIFEQHGWEDAWAYDGIELINIAQRVMQDLSSTGISSNWTLYVVPYANPDGITDGYTNNGPGRCTVTTGIDMNRCWPANFQAYYTSRNYTGSSPLGAPEAVALKSFIESNIGNNHKIVLDIHGWLNKTYGDSEIGSYFTSQFGFSHTSTYGSGYLETWAKSIGAQACLLEYPMPSSSNDIINNNYSGKTSTAIRNMLNEIAVEGGTEVNEIVKVTSNGNVNVRNGAGTSYSIIASLTPGQTVTRIRKGVATADGYIWDKIQLDNNQVGYVATNYIASNVIYTYGDNHSDISIVKAFFAYSGGLENQIDILNTEFDNNLLTEVRNYQTNNNLEITGALDLYTLTQMGFQVNESLTGLTPNSTYTLLQQIKTNYINHGDLYGKRNSTQNGYVYTKDVGGPITIESNAYVGIITGEDEYDSLDLSDLSEEEYNEQVANKENTIINASALCAAFLENAGNNLLYFVTKGESWWEDLSYGAILNEASPYKDGHTMKGLYFDSAMEDSENSKATLNQIANEVMAASEELLNVPSGNSGAISFECMSEHASRTDTIDTAEWYLAINNYRIRINVEVTRNDSGVYSATMTYHILDYYDYETWEETEVFGWNVGWLPFLSSQTDLHYLNKYALARNYTNYDYIDYTITWTQGQRIGSGANLQKK